jgi:glycosyltransferase involved in cell wall biosynthesis
VGLANVVYWLAQEQAQAGHDVTVAILPEKLTFKNSSDVRFRILEYKQPTLAGFAIDQQLFSDIDSGVLQIDIAHLHSLWVPAMVAVARKLQQRGIPYAVSSHGSFSPLLLKKPWLIKQAFRMFFGLRLANQAAFIHLHSADEIQDAKSFGVKSKLVVAEQGIDVSAIPAEPEREWFSTRYPQHGSKFKVVFLGRLDPWHKGIDLLLRATATALRTAPDIILFLVGPEKRRYRNAIPDLIAELGIKQNVLMVGPLYELADKYGALSSADCFALTSRFEGFPLTVLEAMACGTPVIVTPGTNAGGIVRSGHAGLVCAPEPEAIAAALLEMHADSSERQRMRERARQAAGQYTWAKAAALLIGAYGKSVEAAD